MIKEYLEFTKQTELKIEEGRFLIKDPYNGDINAFFKENYLFGVFNCNDSGVSNEYLELIKTNIN